MVEPINILFCGDTALIGSAGSNATNAYTLAIDTGIMDLLSISDLNIVNLEVPVTESVSRINKTGPHLKADPASLKLLVDLKINVACLSNNHIRDYGDNGVLDTINHCAKHRIKTIGAGKDIACAAEPLVLTLRGLTIALFNFSESEFNYATENRAGSNPADPMHIFYSVKKIRDSVDYVFVVMHGGKELYSLPTPAQLKLYRFVVDIGADAVIGHHSHVIGGYEFYRNKPIVYSLGNFIFDEESNRPEWYIGAIAQILVSRTELRLNFYQTKLNYNIVANKTSQTLTLESTYSDYMIEINEIDVFKKWGEIVSENYEIFLANILRFNRYKKLLLKMGLIRFSEKDFRFLLQLGNRVRCLTHSEELLYLINKHINTKK